MYKFKSKYAKYMFFYKGVCKEFHNGTYTTSDVEEVKLLNSFGADVTCVEKPATAEKPSAPVSPSAVKSTK